MPDSTDTPAPVGLAPSRAAPSLVRAATLVLFVNAIGLIVFLQARAPRLLAAVVDPLHPDWQGMETAFAGFVLYGVSLLALAAIAALVVARAARRRLGASAPAAGGGRWLLASTSLAAALTACVVLVLVEVLLFQDYGIHFYEFAVFRILADAALRRDLGIQPAEVARVTLAASGLLLAELTLCLVALRAARWRNGALARACAAALIVTTPGGLVVFRAGERQIESDRAEFEGALPLGKQLLLRSGARPFIAVTPRVGGSGYPIPDASTAPAFARKPNIVFFVADGLRGDMFTPALMPNLRAFSEREDVITSRRHISTGHVSEAGIFGLVYGLSGQSFHSFMDQRVPSYPLGVLKRNGYHTVLLASSRLSPYPSNQLLHGFDEVLYPANDDEAIAMLQRYAESRRRDGIPYFVLGFFYTPHYPFMSAKPHLRKFPMAGPKSRSNYMNDVLQADDYFRQALDVVRADVDSGRAILVATSDHGEEIRDHGVFGHASATFWNEKIVVPFAMSVPAALLGRDLRAPALTSHADIWPTVLDAVGATPHVSPARYSDGRSLLGPPQEPTQPVVTGRFFPHADRPSVLVDSTAKYWFRVAGVGANDRLCIVVTRVTDLDDKDVGVAATNIDARMVPAFERFQAGFWRFIRPATAAVGRERPIC